MVQQKLRQLVPTKSIRYIDQKTGMVTTFAGSGTSGNTDSSFEVLSYAGVNSALESLLAAFGAPSSVCVDKDGTVYVLEPAGIIV